MMVASFDTIPQMKTKVIEFQTAITENYDIMMVDLLDTIPQIKRDISCLHSTLFNK